MAVNLSAQNAGRGVKVGWRARSVVDMKNSVYILSCVLVSLANFSSLMMKSVCQTSRFVDLTYIL